ncbi:MAG: histidine phosphatase family protein [Thermosynechococcaceae cyanobacterium]
MNGDPNKIWMSLSVCLFASATTLPDSDYANATSLEPDRSSNAPTHFQASYHDPIFTIAEGGEKGEGGEGGEGGEEGGFPDKMKGEPLLADLRKGGYVIYLVHTQTEETYANSTSAQIGYCATQPVISVSGWQQAKEIGQAFQGLRIPVEQVFSSEYCCAWQTADLAFGRFQKMAALNLAPAEKGTQSQQQQMRNALLPLLKTAPVPGTNTVIVGHAKAFEAATGISTSLQGTAYLIKPNLQGGFEIIADLLPYQWAKLSR